MFRPEAGSKYDPIDASTLVDPDDLATVMAVLPMRDRVKRKEKEGERGRGKGKEVEGQKVRREGGRMYKMQTPKNHASVSQISHLFHPPCNGFPLLKQLPPAKLPHTADS